MAAVLHGSRLRAANICAQPAVVQVPCVTELWGGPVSAGCPNLSAPRPLLHRDSFSKDVRRLAAVHQDWRLRSALLTHPQLELQGSLPLPRSWPRYNWHQTYRSDFEKDEEEMDRLYDRTPREPEDEYREQSSSEGQPLPSTSGRGLPVYVMLPLDTVWLVERDGKQVSIIKREKALDVGLRTLRKAGVEGVMVDVWWGIAEEAAPGRYDFSAYQRLFAKVAEHGLKVQAVMSFHAAGGNVGDTCKIPLPKWVLHVGEGNPDIFYTDRKRVRNKEYISLGCDDLPLFWGRTPVQMYCDFTAAFVDAFSSMFGSVITELTVGMGPAGELRYPSYPEGDGRWRFPGVGEFQCFDRYMLASLYEAAMEAGQPAWGLGGPHDAGHYNATAEDTGFFCSYGSWNTPYGRFFLAWYSDMLLRHCDRIMGAATAIINKRWPQQAGQQEPVCQVGAKLAGVHWWWKTASHAAELTAGYYNTWFHDGYSDVMAVLAGHRARASFTCVEMRDCEHPPEGACSPQGLLDQVIKASARHAVPLAGENALQRYDRYAFDRIAESAFGQNARAGHLVQLTFLRMGDLMFDNWDAFAHFVQRLHGAGSTGWRTC